MAKSLRSKRRQKILGIRRQKYKERELKKCWAKHLSKQKAEQIPLKDEQSGHQLEPSSVTDPEGDTAMSMETITQVKYSNSQLKKIQEKWGTGRSRKKLKMKRLKKKGHSQW